MAGAVSASLAVWRGPASHLPQDTSACTPSGTVCRQRFHDSMAVLPCAASVCLEAGRGFVLKGASRCHRHARPSVASCRADLQADAMGANVAKDGQGRPGCTVGKVGKGAMVASARSALVSAFGRSGPSGFLPVARALSHRKRCSVLYRELCTANLMQRFSPSDCPALFPRRGVPSPEP